MMTPTLPPAAHNASEAMCQGWPTYRASEQPVADVVLGVVLPEEVYVVICPAGEKYHPPLHHRSPEPGQMTEYRRYQEQDHLWLRGNHRHHFHYYCQTRRCGLHQSHPEMEKANKITHAKLRV